MRTIKFRVWETDKTTGTKRLIGHERLNEKGVWQRSTIEYGIWVNGVFGKGFREQFTDLLDGIGKEIYAGDIVKRTICMRDYAECDGVVEEIYEVEYSAPGWLPFLDVSSSMDEYEIIGNIHDNPELLKGE